jgi:RHS repeat-associated protein
MRACLQHVALSFLLVILQPGLQANAATPFPVTYQVPLADLSVKVWGGSVVIQSGYNEGAWQPNLKWLPITFSYDNFDGSIKTITRNRVDYTKVSAGVYQDPYKNILRQTATGFRWSNPINDWIEYNPAGEFKAYGDRNGIVASFLYSGGTGATGSEGHIVGILDHLGAQILWYDYDIGGKLIRIRDSANRKVEYQRNGDTLSILGADGNTWTYAVTGLGASITITDPEARVTVKTWFPNGAQASIANPDGTVTTYSQDYDAAKGITYYKEVSPGGKITETWSELKQDRSNFLRRDINGVTVAKQSLDTANRITTMTDARGLDTVVTKDQWENITKIVYPDGSMILKVYEPVYSNVTQKIDENGTVTQNSYDAKGNLTKTVEAAGTLEQRTTDYTYDANSYRVSMIRKGDANTPDAVTLYAYDNNGNVITVTDPEGGITRYTYDVMGNALTRTDPRGKLWMRSLDNAGRLLSVTDPLNHTTTIAYDKSGLPVSLTDAANNTSTLGYDAAGRLLTVTDPYGASTRYSYDKVGNIITITDAENHTLKLDYDLDDRLVKQADGNNNVTQFIYGDQATGMNRLLVRIIYPTLSHDLQYDQRKRIIQTVDTSAGAALALDASPTQTTLYQYERKGHHTATINPASRSTNTRYDGLGRVTQTTDTAGGMTQYGYDTRGNLTKLTDAKGNIHHFEYDRLDRMVREIRPLGQTSVYTYDASSNLSQITDPKGQAKQYIYDDANRLVQENHYPTSGATTPVKTINYRYNILNRLTGYDDGIMIANYVYDTKQLRPIRQDISYGSFTLSSSTSYNALGQKTSITYPDGEQYGYTYNSNNQLSTVNLPTGYGSITYNSYLWTVPSQITLPGGTVRNLSYDGLLRLKNLTVKDPGQSQVMGYQYGYDLTGNIVAKTTETGKASYSYDTLDRLAGANYTGSISSPQTNESYTYDPVTNRSSSAQISSYIYNENNQLISAGSITYTYDANGNTINQTDAANPSNSRSYVYDTDNWLDEVRDGSTGTPQAGNLIVSYSYDPFGRRLSKDVGGSKTFYLYNEDGLISEANASGQIIKSYGYAPGSTFSTNPLWQKIGAAYYTYQNDHLGTPMKLLNQSGAVVWSATYDAFGKASVDPASIIGNNLRFPGQYADAETGLLYNWMRYYDPGTGRYITSDPIGLRGGINTYTYVMGDPISLTDPKGLWGVGVNAGGTGEAGMGTGGSVQANSGVGVFGGGSAGTTLGGYTAKGGFASGSYIPQSNSFAVGASAGLGVGAFMTNAKCADDLLGPFDTWTVNLPIFSAQFATDGTIWTAGVSVGKSWGFSASRYSVSTETATGCGCK